MKGKYLCFFFVFFFGVVNAQTQKEKQTKKLDSFYEIWKDESQSDSIRVRSFTRYIWTGYLHSNPDSIPILTDRLLDYSILNDNQYGIATAYLIKGVNSTNHSDYIEAIDYHSKCLEIYKSINSKKN